MAASDHKLDYAGLQRYHRKTQGRMELQAVEIFGTTQELTFNSSGQVSKIVHKKNGAEYRVDVFTYSNTTITEARTIADIGTLTIATNLETLNTTVTFVAA